MKKYYKISLVISFVVAVVCLGVFASIVSKWGPQETGELNKMTFLRSLEFNWNDRQELGKATDENPVVVDAQGLKEIHLTIPKGNVRVVASEDSQVKLTAQSLSEGCQMVITKNSEELEVKFTLQEKKKEGCSGSVVAEIPARLEVELRGGQNDVTIEKITGEIDVRLGVGKLQIHDAEGKIRSEIGMGDVFIATMSSDLKVDVGAGKVDLKLLKKLQGGDWKINAGAGSIHIELPEGQVVKEKYTTGMGSQTLANKDKTDSDFEIRAKSGVGDIVATVK